MVRRSQWRVATIMTSLRDIIIMMSFFAFTKMADSQKLSVKKKKKKKNNFAINLHIFWFDFSKAITFY